MATWIILVLMSAGAALAQPAGPTREISGTVLDGDGQPVASATVAVTGGGPTATTAADGTFKLARVAAANLTLEVTAEGFTARQVAILGARTALQLQVVLVRPPPPAPVPTRTIAGVVTDQARAPVVGAVVRVRGTELAATTAADGTFAIAGAPASEAMLDIEAAGQPPATQAVPADKSTVVVAVGAPAPEAPPQPVGRTVRGKVIDPVTGDGIAAAQVTLKATGAVTFTDGEGNFQFEGVAPGPVFLDLEGPEREPRSFELAAGAESATIPLALLKGEQIVIEGRAPVIVKQSLASSASVVDSAELNRVSAATLDSAMQGKLAGSNIQTNSGAPGGGAQLRLRGISTINGQASPLYVIDGVVISNVAVPSGANAITGAAAGGNASNQDNPVNRIADLNPNDIETVEVLKGASAAALYGSKASNGVVIITTKRGRSGENRVSVTQRVGFATVSNKLGSRTFRSVDEVKEAYGDDSPLVQEYMSAGGRTFDLEDAITRVPFSRETIASASGGSDNGNYFGSVLVRDEPGVVIGTYYRKQTGRIAVGYKLHERLRVGVTANVLHSTSDRGLTNNDNTGTSYYVVLSGTPNFVDLRERNGVFPVNPSSGVGSGANLLQTVKLFDNREDVWRIIGGATAALDAYKSDDGTSQVKVLANFGADSFDQKNNILSPNELTFEPRTDGLAGTVIDASTTNLNANFGAGAVWTYTPKSRQFRNALSGGLTYETVDLNSVYVVAQNLIAGQPSVDSSTSVGINQNRLRTRDSGLYAQNETALLDDQLSLLAGLLAERSSLNGDADKLFFYPKVAAVYSLLGKAEGAGLGKTFDALRVRAAYGEAGNRPNYAQKFTPLNASQNIEGNGGVTVLGNVGEETIEPERQREIEIGADAALKDQRLVAEVTLYNRTISNLLLQRALATSTGFVNKFLNGGSLRNLGVELALQGTPVTSKALEWVTRGVLTLNRSKIRSLPVPAFDINNAGFGAGLGAFRIEEGKSATQIVGTVGGGRVEALGDGEPDFRIGWTNTVKAGAFSFGMLIDWQQGSNIVNLTRLLYDSGGVSPDPEAANERITAFGMGDIRPYIEDATFVKLREISVTYDVPKAIASQIGPLKTLSVNVSGRNLLTLTDYSGLDPEVSNFANQPIGRNYDVAPYPPSRSYWLSITAGL
jgi:TonB-dependent SusC/RagA subfamily outer membrane receptor